LQEYKKKSCAFYQVRCLSTIYLVAAHFVVPKLLQNSFWLQCRLKWLIISSFKETQKEITL